MSSDLDFDQISRLESDSILFFVAWERREVTDYPVYADACWIGEPFANFFSSFLVVDLVRLALDLCVSRLAQIYNCCPFYGQRDDLP